MPYEFGSPVFLYGPSGSGKTSIGKKLAEIFGWNFIDLDLEIEKRAGSTIPEIFETQGETIFRQYETNFLTEVIIRKQPAIISLGGGALLAPENRLQVERVGRVVCLTASADTLANRLSQDLTQRPLINGVEGTSLYILKERLTNLLNIRDAHYSSFEIQLNTDGKTIEEAVHLIQVRLGIFRVKGMGRSYFAYINPGALNDVVQMFSLSGLNGPIAMVADSNVAAHYADQVNQQFKSQEIPIYPITIPAGENFKRIDTVIELWDSFIASGIERTSTVLALGGGVVGDLTGFAAATYLRGIRWASIPTTLLSMVDASLGGKTGIDLSQGKNLAGSFHAPSFVLVDPLVLNTLPKAEFACGMAEVIKAGVVADEKLFALCAEGIPSIETNLLELIQRAMGVKIHVIEIDPYEKGERAALNYGHTLGHAIELISGYQIKHGEAISIGMVLEARLAEMMQLCPSGLSDSIAEVLKGSGLPTELPPNCLYEDITQVMKNDKKRLKGTVRFALPSDIGKVITNVVVEEKWINQLF